MPLQNRVSPDGTLVAIDARGTMLGNRGGCFHRPDQTLLPRPFASRQWICCVLDFKGRRRRVMSPGLYTELFFLDEATALAAGHRPCFECRRAAAVRFAELWNAQAGRAGRAAAPAMDLRLHAERLENNTTKRCFQARLGGLPPGAMVLHADQPALVMRSTLRPWTFHGYLDPVPMVPERTVTVLTPPTTVAILKLGFAPRLHPSIAEAADSRADPPNDP